MRQDELNQILNDGMPLHEDISVQSSLERFFERFQQSVIENGHYGATEKKLKYMLMRRFIFTAYNNLVEMDHTISAGKVSRPKREIDQISKLYDELQIHLTKPLVINYERIYLSQQTGYNKVKDHMESRKHLIETLNTQAATINMNLKDIDKEMKQHKSGSKRFKELESRYKKINATYVDTLHDVSEIKNSITKMATVIEEFKTRHFKAFTKAFQDYSQQVSESMFEILDGLAYEFDTLLWEEAKQSQVIREFFAASKIQGSFSSKTFLHYFLRNLGQENIKEEHKQLFELSHYLETIGSKNIIIIGEKHDDVYFDKQVIEAIDKDFTVTAETNPNKLFSDHQRKAIDILIIDQELRITTGLDIIQEFWKQFPQTRETVTVLLRFKEPSYDQLNQAGKLGIRFFQQLPASGAEIREKFMMMV